LPHSAVRLSKKASWAVAAGASVAAASALVSAAAAAGAESGEHAASARARGPASRAPGAVRKVNGLFIRSKLAVHVRRRQPVSPYSTDRSSARGPFTGLIQPSLSRPARANALRIAAIAPVACSRVANQPNTLGPAPDKLAPRAP